MAPACRRIWKPRSISPNLSPVASAVIARGGGTWWETAFLPKQERRQLQISAAAPLTCSSVTEPATVC